MLALTTMIPKLRKYFILSLAMHNYLPVFFLKMIWNSLHWNTEALKKKKNTKEEKGQKLVYE